MRVEVRHWFPLPPNAPKQEARTVTIDDIRTWAEQWDIMIFTGSNGKLYLDMDRQGQKFHQR